MQSDNFVFPFLSSRSGMISDENYIKSIQTRFFPNFKLASMSSGLLLLNIIIFVVMHIAFKSTQYTHFLDWPREMDKWLLDIQLIKSNRFYIYQAFTSLFMHSNYLHILGNTIFGLFIMYEMENSWKWSIPMGIVAGSTANCLAVLTLEGRALGFSGVLTSYIGMLVLLLVTHLNYFESRARGAYCWLLAMVVFLTIAAIGFGSSVLIHLYGFVLGIILAAGFYPRHYQSSITPACDKIFKVIAVGVVAGIIALAVILG